jgi:hypothetical protein
MVLVQLTGQERPLCCFCNLPYFIDYMLICQINKLKGTGIQGAEELQIAE